MKAVHGGDIYGNPGITMDFSVNINPLGMPDFVKKAVLESLEDCSRYPDVRCGKAAEAAASLYGISEDTLIFGNGAAELIHLAVRASGARRAVITAPSFLEYEAALSGNGVHTDFFLLRPENGFSLDPEAFTEFLREKKPDMIFLCNPANPTGVLTGKTAMNRILEYCRKEGILAVVDECFLEFLEEPGTYSALDLVKSGAENLLVLQAATKTFAVPGLRIGYGFLACRKLKERMENLRQPWSVSVPAQAAVKASFGKEREEFLMRTREYLKREKPVLASGLSQRGFRVFESAANYLLFRDRTGRKPGELYTRCLEHGVLIRSCANYRGLDGRYYRICVSGHEENQRFLGMMDCLL